MTNLNTWLRAEGIETWIDRRSIPVSVPWLDEIRAAIERADIVVYCHSTSWYRSAACQSEQQLAVELGKQVVTGSTDETVETLGNEILTALRFQEPWVSAHTDLISRSGDWVRAGRPTDALLSGSVLAYSRRLAANPGVTLPEATLEFLRRGARRRRNRRIVGFASTAAAFIALCMLVLTLAVAGNAGMKAAQATLNASITWEASFVEVDPYDRMRAALGAIEWGRRLDQAHDPNAESSYAATLMSATALTVLTPVAAAESAGGAPKTASDWRAEVTEGSAIVTVTSTRDPAEFHVVTASAPAQLATASDNGLSVAVVSGAFIEVIGVDAIGQSTLLAGAPDKLSTVWWEGRDVVAETVSGKKLRWSPKPTRVISAQDRSIAGAAPVGKTGEALVAYRDGEIDLISIASGKVRQVGNAGPATISVGVNDLGTTIAVSGKAEVVLFRQGAATPTHVSLSDCVAGPPVVDPSGERVFVGCVSAPLLQIDTQSGQVVSRVAVERGTSGAVALSQSGMLVVGSQNGKVFEIDAGNSVARPIKSIGVSMPVSGLVFSPDGTKLLSLGIGGGAPGASFLGDLQSSGEWNWTPLVFESLVFHTPGIVGVRAATFSPDGKQFVLGMGDGTAQAWDTASLNPRSAVLTGPGQVRSGRFGISQKVRRSFP